MRTLTCASVLALVAGCAPAAEAPEPLPIWSFEPAMVFPADHSLTRPEDGVALADGRIIVADQIHGLRLVETDGTSRPFGDLAGAGYPHHPPDHNGGANGVSLEPDGAHLLLADVFGGGIYRVEVTSGATERVYQHRYGVNAAVRDSRGAIWFTQSTANTPEAGEARLWASVEVPTPDGALLRLGWQDGILAAEAVVVVDSLLFPNGLAIDEPGGHLYLAQTVGGRVLRFRVDVATGRVSEPSVFAELAVDNMRLDGEGRLWMVSPLSNELVVMNTVTGERHSAFLAQTTAQRERVAEFTRRGEAGESRMELLSPELWAPLPGIITGVILGPGHGPVYLTGLGDALIRLPR